MASPPLSDIRAATNEVVKNARKKDLLSYVHTSDLTRSDALSARSDRRTLTPRMIRQEVERVLKLEPGTLDVKSHKDAVKDATDAALV